MELRECQNGDWGVIIQKSLCFFSLLRSISYVGVSDSEWNGIEWGGTEWSRRRLPFYCLDILLWNRLVSSHSTQFGGEEKEIIWWNGIDYLPSGSFYFKQSKQLLFRLFKIEWNLPPISSHSTPLHHSKHNVLLCPIELWEYGNSFCLCKIGLFYFFFFFLCLSIK